MQDLKEQYEKKHRDFVLNVVGTIGFVILCIVVCYAKD